MEKVKHLLNKVCDNQIIESNDGGINILLYKEGVDGKYETVTLYFDKQNLDNLTDFIEAFNLIKDKIKYN
jgi:hypothetical protein